jgi:NADH-quinone oxidoreductase subunit L
VLMRHLSEKLRHRFFALSFSESYAEALLAWLWGRLKGLSAICHRWFSPFLLINIILGLLLLVTFGQQYIGSKLVHTICAVVLGTLAIFVAIAALGVRRNPGKVLWMTGLSAGFKGLSAIYLSPENALQSTIYFGGISAGFAIAWFALRYIPQSLQSTEYAGVAETHPVASTGYLVGILWISGFTFSPTFFGEDLLLHYGAEKFAFETFFIGSAFILNGVTLLRSYVKLAFAK